MRNIFVFLGALLLVDDVSGVDVSVMEGDSVTLNPDTEIPEDDTAEWFFGKVRIARINKAAGLFSTSDGDDGRFRGKLELDKQTGSLTITNTRTNHAGLYKLQIRSKTETSEQIFSVTVSGGAMKTVSVKEGETITLETGLVKSQGYDLLWMFGDQLMAEINKTTNQFLIHDTSDKRFRLQRHHQSVSLIIIDSRITDTGVYYLNMISSSHTIQRNISVTVSEPDLQVTGSDRSGSVSGISGASVGLMLWAVFLLHEV